jgi:transposase
MRRDFPIIVIPDAGLDRLWTHRVLEQEGIESHIVGPSSTMTSPRRRRAKTDGIDGETDCTETKSIGASPAGVVIEGRR